MNNSSISFLIVKYLKKIILRENYLMVILLVEIFIYSMYIIQHDK